MHYSTVILPLISLTWAFPQMPRAVDMSMQLVSMIDTLNSRVADLNVAVDDYDGRLFGVIGESMAVLKASKATDKCIQQATAIATRSAAFSNNGSSQVVSALADQVTPIQNCLDAIKAKYPDFAKMKSDGLVLDNLQTMKEHTNQFTTAVQAKVTADQAPLVESGAQVLDQSIDEAIAVYA